MALAITTPPCIDGDSLTAWLTDYIGPSLGVDIVYLLPDKPRDCTGESSMFAAIDVEQPIDKPTLLSKVRTVGNAKYALIQDALDAACGAGIIALGYYHVFHKG